MDTILDATLNAKHDVNWTSHQTKKWIQKYTLCQMQMWTQKWMSH